MKRGLPIAHSRPRRGTPHAIAVRELLQAEQPLITIGWLDSAREAAQFARKLCAALIADGVPVAVLVAAERAELAAEFSLANFLQAGARGAKRLPPPEASALPAALAQALAQLAGPGVILALGELMPAFYRPTFSIVVSRSARPQTLEAAGLLQADLEITNASDGLASELARVLRARLGSA